MVNGCYPTMAGFVVVVVDSGLVLGSVVAMFDASVWKPVFQKAMFRIPLPVFFGVTRSM
jgi:hypothetical protein